MKLKLLVLVVLMSTNFAMSQSKTLWQKQTTNNNLSVKQSKQDLPRTHTFTLNTLSLKQALAQAPQRKNVSNSSNVVISFPNANGEFERFRVFEASIMHPELSARYPDIKSYAGQGIDDPTAVIRFSISHLGFQSISLSANRPATFIEALTSDTSVYAVFTRDQKTNLNDDFECAVTESMNRSMISNDGMSMRNADDGILRTYRLVVSATGEYTNYHGGTVADALAAINQTMTRVNGIFEVDFNVTMELIANTDDVIFTNSSTDPYGNTTGNYNNELQSELTSTIGEANYDIGHLFANLQNNGNAGCIGCVCVNNQKGSGWTSATVPEGEFFDVDYVAHEMGHQFGANHTWTFNGNEGTNVQVEPGSGTTIMSYAGITGATDVEQNVTPNFHAVSIEQVTDYVKSTSCQTNTNTMNAVPVVDAGSDFTIPKGTAFVLDGSATDGDTPSNQLSYVWEQMDENNASSTYPSTTATTGVAFRCYEPSSETNRYFPRLETIKSGATSWQWEAVPNVARTLNFRFTVRDNVAGGGTNNSDDVEITVNGTAGPFVVNSPNTNITWNEGSFATVTWDVAGTTGNGINAANVDIFLSTDGGDTYPITLASGVTNDGSHDIVVPNNQGTQNRVMVKGASNIFFDISDTNFTIAAPLPCTATVPTSFIASGVGATSATLSWDNIDNVVFEIQYREVGSGTWIDASTSNTTIVLNGLSPETTYEAQIRSRCPDTSTSAYSSIITFTTPVLPPCTGTQITSFPYLETFDTDLGDWTQASGDDGDWILDANGTPSGSTGPSDDITTGGNYLFLEASSNGSPGEIGANATAILDSPCFDLSGLTEAYFTFYYHSYGADAGTIEVEISGDNGNNWTSIFSTSGDLGNIWNSQSIDLVSYLNQNVKIRIIGTTGNGFASDIAIDHIGIGGPPPITYCDSFGDTQYDTGVTRVIFGSIDNSDGSPKDVGYEDFTNISTDVLQGSSVDLTVQVDTDGNFIVHTFVWIDWNIDGDFDDPGEEYDLGDIQNEANGVLPTLSVAIPESMIFGSTRMRVSAQYNADPTACLTDFDGEVEDYTVNIKYDGLLYSGGTWDPSAPNATSTADNVLILDGDYSPNIDISINNLTINSGATFNVNKANNLLVAGDVTANGSLVLNSDSNEYSSLIVDGTVAGTVSYERHVNIQSGGNDLISAPVTGQTFGAFATTNINIFSNPSNTSQKLFGPWSKITNEYLNYDTDVTADANSTLDVAVGYRSASTDNSSFTFTGTVNTGTVSKNLVYSGPHETEWNLIGNPYPSYINVQNFLNHNLGGGVTNLQLFNFGTAAIYGYDGDVTDGWIIYNLATTTSSTVIAPGQGFFVSADPTKVDAYDLEFTPMMQTTGTSDDFIAGRNAELVYLKLNLSSATNSSKTDFYFNQNASQGFDLGYDAMIWGENPPEFAVYSQLAQDNLGDALALQTLHHNDLNDVTIPLGVNANQGEQITFSILDMNIPNSVNVYLEDMETNTITLLNESDYIMTPSSTLFGTGRFYLRTSEDALSVSELSLETLQLYYNPDLKQIVVNGELTENTSFVLYDIQGREILRTDLDTGNSVNTVSTTNFANGVYLVQLVDTTSSLSKKVIIN